MNWTNTATYITTFAEKHNINVMGGFTAERFAEFQSKASRDDVPNNMDQMQEVNAGTQNQKSEGKTAYSTLVSYLGRVMYNYDNRYYLTASIRADGSSRFPKETNMPSSLLFLLHGVSSVKVSCKTRRFSVT